MVAATAVRGACFGGPDIHTCASLNTSTTPNVLRNGGVPSGFRLLSGTVSASTSLPPPLSRALGAMGVWSDVGSGVVLVLAAGVPLALLAGINSDHDLI